MYGSHAQRPVRRSARRFVCPSSTSRDAPAGELRVDRGGLHHGRVEAAQIDLRQRKPPRSRRAPLLETRAGVERRPGEHAVLPRGEPPRGAGRARAGSRVETASSAATSRSAGATTGENNGVKFAATKSSKIRCSRSGPVRASAAKKRMHLGRSITAYRRRASGTPTRASRVKLSAASANARAAARSSGVPEPRASAGPAVASRASVATRTLPCAARDPSHQPSVPG